jgi:FkbM family methyltransferase
MVFEKLDPFFGKHDRIFRMFSQALEPWSLLIWRTKSKRLQHELFANNKGSRYVVRQIDDGVLVQFDLSNINDLTMLAEIVATGFYERATTFLVRDVLKKGDTFVDVGANIGYFSVIASRSVGEHGEVYALEPSTEAFERLKMNVAINGATNIRIVPKAAHRAAGELRLYLSDIQDGMNSTLGIIKHSASRTIQTTTIDELLGNKKIALIKIDVEGAEREALIGAKNVLSSGNCTKVIVEWYNYSRFTSGELDLRFDFYNKIGKVFQISNSSSRRYYALRGPILNRRELPPGCNLLLIPKSTV